ncbi:MAG: radical SAM protein [Candidatus Hydrogenedentes bacterium]|nr:radical SAM protein [Candidatus Hydrogenedentota bacterium]
MTSDDPIKRGTITRLYQGLTRLYTEIPFRLFREGRSLPPLHYYMEVTRRCNLRCKMCQYIDWLENVPTKVQADGELTTEEWLNVIDQTSRFSIITFTGGEVFVRKDFMQIFEHACSKRRVHFISNATMLTEERAKRCVELAARRLGGRGFFFAGISLDGTRDIHDSIRAQKGAFDRSTTGVRALSRYRDEMRKTCPKIHINTVIQEANLDCLPEMPKIVKDLGAGILNLLTETRIHDIPNLGYVDPSTIGRGDFQQPVIDRKRLDTVLRATLREAERAGIEVRMPRMPYNEVLNHYDQGYNLREFGCRAIWSSLTIGSKGGVYPCWILKVGNVRTNSLKEINNNPAIRDFRLRRKTGGFAVCRGCCEIEYTGKVTESHVTPLPVPPPSAAEDDGTGSNSGQGRESETLVTK